MVTSDFGDYCPSPSDNCLIREGIKKNSTKVGGWGHQWTDFPFFFVLEKKYELKPLKIA